MLHCMFLSSYCEKYISPLIFSRSWIYNFSMMLIFSPLFTLHLSPPSSPLLFPPSPSSPLPLLLFPPSPSLTNYPIARIIALMDMAEKMRSPILPPHLLQPRPETLCHRDDALLYIAYVMRIWAAPIPADRWHCSLWP